MPLLLVICIYGHFQHLKNTRDGWGRQVKFGMSGVPIEFFINTWVAVAMALVNASNAISNCRLTGRLWR